MKPLAPSSQTLYAYWVDRFRVFLMAGPETLEGAQKFLASLEREGLSANTRGIAARAIRRLGLPVPAPTVEMKEPDYIDVDQVRRLLEAAPSLIEKTILTVCFASAARISEILNLEVDDLELDQQVATVTRKGGRRERINLGAQGTEALREWLAQRRTRSARVFMDYDYQYIYSRLRKLGRKVGLMNFHPHLLRHSRVMHLRKAGREWSDISEICGHTRLETTIKIYGRRKAEERADLLVDF